MASVTTYDQSCYDLAESFLSDTKFNTKAFRHLLALEIQQVIEDEISFMEQGCYDDAGKWIGTPESARETDL